MSAQVSHYLLGTMLFVLIVSLTVTITNARPNHFGDSNQLIGDQDSSNLLDTGLKPWQLELLAQRLSEISQAQPVGDYGYEKGLRLPETKRQSRYRQCYFNPISCFRK